MKNFFRSIFEILETIVVAAIIVVVFRSFIGQPFLVDGASMEPSFNDRDYLIVDQLTYRLRDPERGEAIVFYYPGDKSRATYYVKRVIGLPGDHVKVSEGKVLIEEGEKSFYLEEDYILKDNLLSSIGADVTLGDNEYFVVGDNRAASFDSRSWGPLLRDDIVGVVRLRLWPLNKIKFVNHPDYQGA